MTPSCDSSVGPNCQSERLQRSGDVFSDKPVSLNNTTKRQAGNTSRCAAPVREDGWHAAEGTKAPGGQTEGGTKVLPIPLTASPPGGSSFSLRGQRSNFLPRVGQLVVSHGPSVLPSCFNRCSGSRSTAQNCMGVSNSNNTFFSPPPDSGIPNY